QTHSAWTQFRGARVCSLARDRRGDQHHRGAGLGRGAVSCVRDWCLAVPEVVNISINTPYPGTETWLAGQHRLNTRDYRLFDIQHAVLPTKLPIAAFYRELLHTQRVLYRKHMTWWTVPALARELAGNLVRGQTNFMRGIMNYNKVYNVEKMLADHARPV